MARKTAKQVTNEELKAAWDVVADFMNQHKELSFFIDPWSGSNQVRKYNLHYLDDNDRQVEIVRASRMWSK